MRSNVLTSVCPHRRTDGARQAAAKLSLYPRSPPPPPLLYSLRLRRPFALGKSGEKGDLICQSGHVSSLPHEQKEGGKKMSSDLTHSHTRSPEGAAGSIKSVAHTSTASPSSLEKIFTQGPLYCTVCSTIFCPSFIRNWSKCDTFLLLFRAPRMIGARNRSQLPGHIEETFRRRRRKDDEEEEGACAGRRGRGRRKKRKKSLCARAREKASASVSFLPSSERRVPAQLAVGRGK